MLPTFWERIPPNGDNSVGVAVHRLVMAVDRGDRPPLVVAGALSVDTEGGRSGVQVAVLGLGPPVVISELEGPLPGRGLELRTSGLWVDFVCEQPFRHWSYGLEAFALAIDEPGELLDRGFGERVPLGWELEFESEDDPQWIGPPLDGDRRPASGAYRQLGLAHGLLLTSEGTHPVEGRAVRSHAWGRAELPTEVVLAGPAAAHLTGPDARSLEPTPAVALPGLDEVWWVQATAAGAASRQLPYDSSSRRLS